MPYRYAIVYQVARLQASIAALQEEVQQERCRTKDAVDRAAAAEQLLLESKMERHAQMVAQQSH